MSQMRGTTILWSQFIVAAIGAVIALQAATQYVAHKLGHQPQLGEAAYTVLGYPMYWPWQYWQWLYHFDYYAKAIFFQGSLVIYGGMFAVFMALVFMSVNRARRNRSPDTYGSARWGNRKDLQQAGLLNDKGIVLAQTQDNKRQLLRHDGAEHCFVFAPTRSGKGVGIVIPTLLSWPGSVIVYDMKRENWDVTAGWRRRFSHVLRFEPTAEYSVRFNPLLEVRMGENEVRDVQNIADILVDPDGSKERMDHWEKTGHSLLVGVILHVLYAEADKSLRGVANFLSHPQRTINQTLDHMLHYPHERVEAHQVVTSVARELLNKSENELSGVLSTAMSFLGLYRDPVIARNTQISDFSIADLVQADNPVSLYIVIPPSDADRTRPLVRLILNQIGRRLTESLGSGTDNVKAATTQFKTSTNTATKNKARTLKRHQLLMLLDEFPTLGRLTFFETELAYMAGYGIRALMIAQSLNQIEKAYGANNAILDNSHVRVTYGTLDDRTAKRISEMLGTATENRRQTNYAGHRLAPWLGHVMVSEQDSPRPLLTPGEVLQFPQDEALVMVGGYPPYRGLKVRYFADKRFQGRVDLPRPDDKKTQQAEFSTLGQQSPWQQQGRAVQSPSTTEAQHQHHKTGQTSPGNQTHKTDDSGGIRLEGVLQQHPAQGVDLERDLAHREALARERIRQLRRRKQQQEPDMENRQLLRDEQEYYEREQQQTQEREQREQEQQRRQRQQQMGRQRTMEQSRHPGGGGLPL